MHERFSQRIEEGLTRLASRLARARKPQDRGKLERQVGRLLGRNSRAAARYQVRFVDDTSIPAGARLEWSVSSEWDEWARHSEGCYVLRTNVTKWSSEELWRTYVQLSDAESAFRVQKSDLSIRPVWHHTASRVKAHVLVCFLAYVLWKTLEAWQERAGLGNSPRLLLDELATIQSADVVLPLADQPGREMRLRCVVRPEPHQATLLARLGLRLPERLKPLPVPARM
jgi:transposase